MLSNARGAAVMSGAVTTATFRGPPIVVCSSNYNSAFNSLAWSKLIELAALLDVPALHTDVAHDTDEALILTVLGNLQRFFVPGTAAPWIWNNGTAYPICGPLFFFDGQNPATDSAGTGAWLANRVALGSMNFRRNGLYGLGVEGIWPNASDLLAFNTNLRRWGTPLVWGGGLWGTGTNNALDSIQRPPIHKLHAGFAQTSPNWFISVTLPQWRAPQLGMNSIKSVLAAGYSELSSREAAYPGISRHVNPSLVNSGLFTWPWA